MDKIIRARCINDNQIPNHSIQKWSLLLKLSIVQHNENDNPVQKKVYERNHIPSEM